MRNVLCKQLKYSIIIFVCFLVLSNIFIIRDLSAFAYKKFLIAGLALILPFIESPAFQGGRRCSVNSSTQCCLVKIRNIGLA